MITTTNNKLTIEDVFGFIKKREEELKNNGAEISEEEINAIKLEFASNLSTPIETLIELQQNGNDKIKHVIAVNLWLKDLIKFRENKYTWKANAIRKFYEDNYINRKHTSFKKKKLNRK